MKPTNIIVGVVTGNAYETLALECGQVLRANDLLGFDTMGEAARAILDHPDWADRWEVPMDYDRRVLREWRAARLNGRKVAR